MRLINLLILLTSCECYASFLKQIVEYVMVVFQKVLLKGKRLPGGGNDPVSPH